MTASTRHLCIRADASAAIGVGHLMRCLAIAQAARDAGHTVTLVTAEQVPDTLANLWQRESIHVEQISAPPGSADDARATHTIASKHNAACLLIDGYQFGEAFFETLAPRGREQGEGETLCTAALHDLPGAPLPAVGLIINPNPGVTPPHYARHQFSAKIHCGSDYTPLQRHIAAQATQPRPADSRILFASFGGSDATQLREWLCSQFDALRAADITLQLICGPTNPRAALLQQFLPMGSALTNVAPIDFARHAHAARAAIVAAGSTCWELAALGVPQWAIVTAPNQNIVADGLDLHRWGRASSRAFAPDIEELIEWFNYALPPAKPLNTSGAARCITALMG